MKFFRLSANRTKKSSARRRANRPLWHRVLLYVPALVVGGLCLVVYQGVAAPNGLQTVRGNHSVLAYATSVSIGELLSQTNSERSQNGQNKLTTNSQLNAAAQAKANDMVSRDYWSHNTPDGLEPWTFIANAGYKYQTAGENLAYGFATSNDTIAGWMNSPPHKDNLLNTNFTEVGFGFANSSDFVGHGQTTVVVAMYGKPPMVVSAAPKSSSPAAKSVPVTTPSAKSTTSVPAQSTPQPTTPEPKTETQSTPAQQEEAAKPAVKNESAPSPATSPASRERKIPRVQILTNGNVPWSAAVIAASVVAMAAIWVMQRGFRFRQLYVQGERLMMHHLHIDLTVIALMVLGFLLLQTSGVVR